MKHTNKTLFVLLWCTIFSFTCISSLSAESPKREFRATWLATVWAIDWPKSTNVTTQKSELTTILDNLVAANMNAVCFQVRGLGDVMYQSDLEPWNKVLTGTRGKDPGYDPLAFAIEEAHKRGLELHAWINPFRYESTSGSHGTSDPVRKNHPDWLITYNNGSFSGTLFDPGLPEVRDYVVKVVKEVVDNYDIDGVIFDDYFYPYGGTTTEDAASKAAYKPSNMTDTEWRCDNIDKTMKGVYDMIAASKRPWVRFGISPFGTWTTQSSVASKYGISLPAGITSMDAYEELACNTISWMQGGYVDYISPQLYWPTTSSGQSYITLSKWWSDMAKHFSDLLPGNQKVHFFSSQSPSSNTSNSEQGKEIDYNRQYDQLGAPGSIYYNTSAFVSTGLHTYLPANKYTQEALPPAMDWKMPNALSAPTNVTLSGSTLSWSHSSADRFTVYAYTKGSDNATAIASSSNLVRVVYGKSLDVSSVSGYANKTFAVCAYDRYGNEHAAGYYNLNITEPILTANPTSFTLNGKVNQTAPYVDIKIEALNLTSTISVNSVTKYVTVAKQSDWNNLTGGTIRATLSTDEVMSGSDYYIAVASGDTKITIPFSATVVEPVPTITASTSSISLSGMQNSAFKPYKDVTVTASDLTADIAVSVPDLVTYTTLTGWNARTGGTLRLTLNNSKTVGNHTGTVTITSGTVTRTITINATITEGPQAGTVAITALWNKSSANGTFPSYMGTDNNNRSIAYYAGKLYIPVYSAGNFHIVDAATGNLSSTKSLGVSATYHAFNLCITDDGQLLSGNSALSNNITVAAVDKANGGCVEQTSSSNIGRSDYFDVYGNWNESGYIISYGNAGTAAYIPFKQGTLQTSSAKTLTIGGSGTSSKAIAYDETSFYAQTHTTIPQRYAISTGEVLETFGDDAPISGLSASGMAVFTVANHIYMITPASSTGAFDIFEITEGLGKATRVIEATASLGSTLNNAVTVDFATHVDGNDAYIYVIAPNNGVAAYKFTFTPEAAKIPVITPSAATVTLSGKVNQSEAPYVDVKITAQYLSEAISVASTGSGFSVAKVSGWNDLTGGTLRFTLNTALEANTYTGAVTLKSGDVSQTINVTATVNPLQPAITVGESAISLSAKINTTAPYKNVTVDAADLSENLAIETSSDLVTITKNDGWNDRKGGSIRITLNTAYTAGTHTATVTIKSGTTTQTITVTGTITPLQPVITLGQSAVTFTCKQDAAVAPYQDIAVTAADLSADITVEASSELVTVTKNAGWNNRTGGYICITLNTAQDLGDHTCTVTVTSGDIVQTITVNATINDLEPKLSASTTALSLWGEQSATAPYQDIKITGTDLSDNISITSTASSAVIITKQSDWNDLTGGTLRVALSTSSIDTYAGTITISSGSASIALPFEGKVTAVGSGNNNRYFVVSSPAVSLVTTVGVDTYVDVVVTGKNLNTRYSISISDDMGVVTTATQSGWNTRSGGTLRINVDASTAGTYTGTITIKSGSNSNATSTTIAVTAYVNNVNTEMKASTSSISLAAEQHTTADYQDVTITATEVVSDITITTANAPITVSPQSDWDARTGGTLRIALNTEEEIGYYIGSVIVASGSASVVIEVKADILTPTPKEGTITFDANALWTQTPSTLSCLSTESNNRSMALYNGRLYISDKGAGAYHILDAETGSFINTIPVSYNDFEQHNLRITTDGQMLFGNTGAASSAITLRSWNMLSNNMTELGDVTISGRSDYFYPYGEWSQSGFLLALANSGALVKIPYVSRALQTAQTLSTISLQPEPNSDTAADGTVPKSAKAIPASASTFYTTATYNIPVKYNMDGSLLDEFSGSEQPAYIKASGLGTFSLHGHNYMITPATEKGGFDIFDITDGLYAATRVVNPTPALGSNDNAAMTIDYCTRVEGNDAYIYEFVPNNGVRAYKFTFTPKAVATELDDIVSNVRIMPTLTGVSVYFTGTERVTIYTVNGTQVTSAMATDHYTCDLPQGLYIIRVGAQAYKFVK